MVPYPGHPNGRPPYCRGSCSGWYLQFLFHFSPATPSRRALSTASFSVQWQRESPCSPSRLRSCWGVACPVQQRSSQHLWVPEQVRVYPSATTRVSCTGDSGGEGEGEGEGERVLSRRLHELASRLRVRCCLCLPSIAEPSLCVMRFSNKEDLAGVCPSLALQFNLPLLLRLIERAG